MKKEGGEESAHEEQKPFEFKFVKIPNEHLLKLYSTKNLACFTVYCQVYKQWFSNFKYNPVKLNMGALRAIGHTRHTVYKALDLLQSLELIVSYNRSSGRSPDVFVKFGPFNPKPLRRNLK